MASRAIEVPFEIPSSWRWVRLENLCASIADGDHQPPPQQNDGVPFLVISNVSSGNIDFTSTRFVSPEYFNALTDERKAKRGDLLVTVTGSYGIIVPIETDTTFCFQRHMALLKTIEPYNRYLAYCLQSPIVKVYFDSVATGSAQKTVGLSSLRATLLPLPPLSEQNRIVAKIEKLMPLVEEYGRMEEARLQLDAILPTALEKSILQEAIQGKLVPQNPNDESASELLKRVAAERKALAKAGKLKRDKGESVIFRGSDRLAYETRNGETVCIQDEIPFDIPDSWEWVRLGNVSTIVRGSGIKRSETAGSGFPCIRYGEIYTTYGYSFLKTKSFTSEGVAAKCNKANCGDVLCALTGECKEEIAKATAYLGEEPIATGGDLARISNHPYDPMLLVYFMFSPFLLSQKSDKSNGDIIVHIGKEAIENLLIPLPPAAEQKRIAAKVTNLLAEIKFFTK